MVKAKSMHMYGADYGNIQGSIKGYQGMVNQKRFKLLTGVVRPKKKEKILELGCNDGLTLSFMSRFCDNCYGIDVNAAMIKKAKKNGLRNVKVMDASKLEFKNNFFDKIYASHVVEHVAEIRQVFKEACRVLKPSGRLIVLFPWEAFRGMRALKEAVSLSDRPLRYARQLHLHKLSPARINKIIKDIPFRMVHSSINFTLLPDYLVILEKDK